MRVLKIERSGRLTINTYAWGWRDDRRQSQHGTTVPGRPMKPISAIVFKDVAIELRNKESMASMTMFAVLVLVVFNFAFESTGLDKALVAPGTLWVAISFAAILGLNRSFAMETDNDCPARPAAGADQPRRALYRESHQQLHFYADSGTDHSSTIRHIQRVQFRFEFSRSRRHRLPWHTLVLRGWAPFFRPFRRTRE